MIIDIHTHILPDVDDGARDLQMSVKMLAQSSKVGVNKVIATPHYYPWKNNVSAERIRQLCQEVQESLRKEYAIDMEVYPGQEIVYEVGIAEDLKSGKLLTLADSRYVLIEFMPDEAFSVMHRAVRELTDAGYKPIFAHVERYEKLWDMEKIKDLKKCGALFQMNINSVDENIFLRKGRWGRKLLKEKLIDYLASDMHNLTERSPYTGEKIENIQRKIETKYLEKLLYANGEKIFGKV